jgi:hypothetical protein
VAFVASNRFNNAARGSVTRVAAELANANMALDLSTALSAAGVATATVTSQVKTVNALTYLINGAYKSKAATDNFWTLAGTTVVVGGFQKYLLLIDAAGAASIQEGLQSTVSAASVGWTNVSNVSAWAPLMSILNAGKAIVGVLTIANVTNPFIPGTTLLGAAGVTATYIDGVDPTLFPLLGNEQGLVFGLSV